MDADNIKIAQKHWDRQGKKIPLSNLVGIFLQMLKSVKQPNFLLHSVKYFNRERSWWQSRTIREYVNEKITGNGKISFIEYIKDKYFYQGCDLGISLGSGSGEFDREIIQLGICRKLESLDFSQERIKHCINEAKRENLNIVYFNENIETFDFGYERYDVVFAKSVLHHLEDLETILAKINKGIKKNGIFIVDDFFGPSRFQWTDDQIFHIERLLKILPDSLKMDLILPGQLKVKIARPTVEQMIKGDPTEAVRSSDIFNILQDKFDIIEIKKYGGTIFHQLFNRIMGNFNEKNEKDVAIINLILLYEEELIKNGTLPSDYMVMVLKPKKLG